MSDILSINSEVGYELDESEILDLDSDRAEVVLDALSSETTRKVFISLYDDARTISELADEFNTSIQNMKYHIEKLIESDLIDEKGTKYSEKGNEVSIYGPTNESIVLVVSVKSKKEAIHDALSKVSLGLIVSIVSVYLISAVTELTYNREEQDSVGIATHDVETGTSEQIVIGFVETSVETGLISLIVIGMILGFIISKFLNYVT